VPTIRPLREMVRGGLPRSPIAGDSRPKTGLADLNRHRPGGKPSQPGNGGAGGRPSSQRRQSSTLQPVGEVPQLRSQPASQSVRQLLRQPQVVGIDRAYPQRVVDGWPSSLLRIAVSMRDGQFLVVIFPLWSLDMPQVGLKAGQRLGTTCSTFHDGRDNLPNHLCTRQQ